MQQQESEQPSCVYCENCNIFVDISNLLSHPCFKCEVINNDADTELVDKSQPHEIEGQETIEELLISLVQLRPSLWDHRIALKDRSKNIKDDLWIEIYNAMGKIISIEEMKKKWRNLRDKYIKVKGETYTYKPSGMGAKGKQKVWKHFSALQFMDDCINPKKTIGSLKIPPQDMTLNSDESRPSSSSSACFVNEMAPTDGRKKRKITGELINNKILDVLNIPPPSVNINPSSLYEGNAACLAIAEILNKLPERKKTKLEIELLRLVYDTYNEHISNFETDDC